MAIPGAKKHPGKLQLAAHHTVEHTLTDGLLQVASNVVALVRNQAATSPCAALSA